LKALTGHILGAGNISGPSSKWEPVNKTGIANRHLLKNQINFTITNKKWIKVYTCRE